MIAAACKCKMLPQTLGGAVFGLLPGAAGNAQQRTQEVLRPEFGGHYEMVKRLSRRKHAADRSFC